MVLRWLSGFARISERSSRSRDAARVASRCLLNLFPTRSIVTDSQNAPEVLPELSVSATRLKQAKLKKTPFDHSGGHPGKRWVQRALDVMFEVGNQAIFRRWEADPLPPVKGGVIYVATHINGLVDPMVITRVQKKRVISLGRHDLTTRPVIGWWARKFGTQPVLRRAEIEAGVVDAQFARYINDRSMLTVAACLAAGHSGVVMPEGKSHQDCRLHALRTGSSRSALAAAAIADEKGLPAPVIQTVGLHWRTHYWLRTDHYVEFGESIEIPSTHSAEDRTRLAAGEWVEPSHDDTIALRNRIFDALSPLTPSAPDWPTLRAWKLLAHMGANKADTPLKTLRDEVHAYREVRDVVGDSSQDSLLDEAREAAEILHSRDLDATALAQNRRLSPKSMGERAQGILGALLMISTLPIVLPSSGAQWGLARFMADGSDEGLDARTSYYMLAAMFSPVFFWPPIAFAYVALTGNGILALDDFTTFVLVILAFYITARICILGYDLWSDNATASRRVKLSRSEVGERLTELLESIDSRLGALK